jgi:hypothetical protein
MSRIAYAQIGTPVEVLRAPTLEPIYVERPRSRLPVVIIIIAIIVILIVIIIVMAVMLRRRAMGVRCNTNFDCSRGQLCNGATGTCQQCITNSQCPSAAARCDAVTGTCQQCQSNIDCPSNSPYCSSGSCLGCRSNLDCSANSFFTTCNLATGRCTALI